MTSPESRKFSQKWTKENIRDAFILRSMSPGAKNWVSKNLIPLPSDSTIWRELNFLRLDVGFLKPVKVFLRHLQGETQNSPLERLCGICFDECSCPRIAEYDEFNDRVLGVNRNVQVVILRGLIGTWMVPFLVDFDFKIDVNEFKDIVREAAKFEFTVLVSYCDQGGGNRGLAGRLGVTEDQPYCLVDISEERTQKVFFLHDFIHIFKGRLIL